MKSDILHPSVVDPTGMYMPVERGATRDRCLWESGIRLCGETDVGSGVISLHQDEHTSAMPPAARIFPPVYMQPGDQRWGWTTQLTRQPLPRPGGTASRDKINRAGMKMLM